MVGVEMIGWVQMWVRGVLDVFAALFQAAHCSATKVVEVRLVVLPGLLAGL